MANGQGSRPKGRPPGAKSIDYAQAETIGPRCKNTRCGGTRFRDRKRIRVFKHNGIAPDGKEYNCIEWHRCFCVGCGQATIVREFHVDPDLKTPVVDGGDDASDDDEEEQQSLNSPRMRNEKHR